MSRYTRKLSPAKQHSLCILALTLTQAHIGLFKPDKNAGQGLCKLIAKIEKAIEECSKPLRKRKISAGAKRDLDVAFEAVAPHLERLKEPDADVFRIWAALIWAALSFVDDVWATCDYGKTQQWIVLRTHMTKLADYLMELEPGMDEEGTEIYLEAA